MEETLGRPPMAENTRRKQVDFMVALPNHIAYSFQLPYDCKGQACLDKVCTGSKGRYCLMTRLLGVSAYYCGIGSLLTACAFVVT